MANNNNVIISLKRMWLIVVIVAMIGSPFLAFGLFKGGVSENTGNIEINRQDIKDIESSMNDPEHGIAALNGKMDVLIGLVSKIEKTVNHKGK